MLGELLHDLNGDGNMARIKQQVVAQVVLFQRRQAAQKVAAEHEAVVGFVVHDVAYAGQARARGEARQLRLDIIRAHIHPTDNATHKVVFVGEFASKNSVSRRF